MIPSLAEQLRDYRKHCAPVLEMTPARRRDDRQRAILAWVQAAGWWRVPELRTGVGYLSMEGAASWARRRHLSGLLERRGARHHYEYRWKA